MNNFITFRRYYLDLFLNATAFHGRVLDVGGKKDCKRGTFRPPYAKVEKWEYLNIDVSTNPDYCCRADAIPVDACTFDFVVMTEVLEHLEIPELVLSEIQRVLKRGGYVVATIPFLYPIHADPDDFQRWTPTKLKVEFEKVGLVVERIEAMGGLFAVIYDLLYIAFKQSRKNMQYTVKNKLFYKVVMPVLRRVFLCFDRRGVSQNRAITTGFYICALRT